jgi:hypothetical protein
MAQNEVELALFQKTSKMREDLANIFGEEVPIVIRKKKK